MVKNTGLWRFAVMNANRVLVLVSLACALFCSTVANGRSCIFQLYPDGQPCTSPNGRYTIENLNRTEEPHHILMLKDNGNNTVRKLYSYDREASIVWSPDSQKLLLNDYAGSDYTLNYILYVNEQRPVVDLKQALVQNMAKKERRSATNNDHFYVSGLEWIEDSKVKLIAWGHGSQNPNGFCRCYIYVMTGGVTRCKNFHLKKAADAEDHCEQLKK